MSATDSDTNHEQAQPRRAGTRSSSGSADPQPQHARRAGPEAGGDAGADLVEAPQHARAAAGDETGADPVDPPQHARAAAAETGADRVEALPKRAPLPQWWWDQSVRTRRIIALGVVLVLIGGLVFLVTRGSSSSDDPAQTTAAEPENEVDREARLFVAGLPFDRVATWDSLAECESEGDWGKATGNGFYGGLQFTQTTWIEFGGPEGSPHEWSREVQIMIAERVQEVQGWGAWPACTAQLGIG